MGNELIFYSGSHVLLALTLCIQTDVRGCVKYIKNSLILTFLCENVMWNGLIIYLGPHTVIRGCAKCINKLLILTFEDVNVTCNGIIFYLGTHVISALALFKQKDESSSKIIKKESKLSFSQKAQPELILTFFTRPLICVCVNRTKI